MSLTRVTITGADDAVAPSALIALSEEFPFVEWGILMSQSRTGQPRHPNGGWLNDFYDEFQDPVAHDSAHAAVHLCGGAAASIFDGDFSLIASFGAAFRRIQLNGVARRADVRTFPNIFRLAIGHPHQEIILQAPTPEMLLVARQLARWTRTWPIDDGIRNISALFDPSGGRGTAPATWAEPPDGLRVGYAGGITPHNVVQTIAAISSVTTEDFWIDLESGARTDDAFDLAKVRAVLELAKPFVRAPRGGVR